MKILALEPYYGGSHRAFLDGWHDHSRHGWTIIGLDAHHWKWRMRHAPVTLADDVIQRYDQGERWDLLFCSDMLSLTEFLGLAGDAVRELPTLVYFHENQITYPDPHSSERDLHFSLSNLTSCLAATAVWFNSDYNRQSFLDGSTDLLSKMPDHSGDFISKLDTVRVKSSVMPQGIHPLEPGPVTTSNPKRILWAARWEHDKNPEMFFRALFALADRGLEFEVNILGQQFDARPAIFDEARGRLESRIHRWGYQESREEYVAALQESDIVVSTADHEFFGVSVVEAIAAGCYPLLPDRLAYPEIIGRANVANTDSFFYDGSLDDLTTKLSTLLVDSIPQHDLPTLRESMKQYFWPNLAPSLDDALEAI